MVGIIQPAKHNLKGQGIMPQINYAAKYIWKVIMANAREANGGEVSAAWQPGTEPTPTQLVVKWQMK